MDKNGGKLNIDWDVMPVGMHDQKNTPYESFSTGGKMRKSASQSKLFKDGSSSGNGNAGVVNHNDQYSGVTYGY